MGKHNLYVTDVIHEVEEALLERPLKYGEWKPGERIVLEKEEEGNLWHIFYECYETVNKV